MMVATFTAHCQRGHDRIDFTDRDDFTTHMHAYHDAAVLTGPNIDRPWTPWIVVAGENPAA